MKLQHLTQLSARLDHALTHFNLQPDANGEYPWQVAQRQRQKRRVVAGVAGAAAIGAGAYGAQKGIGALKERYGVSSGKDALTVGAADAAQRVKAAAGPMVDKLKGQVAQAGQSARAAMAPMADKLKGQAAQAGQAVKTAVAPAMNAAKRKYAAGAKAVARGMKSGRGIGSVAQRVVRAVVHAQVGPGATLVALEAKLDAAIVKMDAA